LKREFLQLAHSYKPTVKIAGWLLSEKLDGIRALWDGGISRGLPKKDVPWANTVKDARYKEEPIATGLWTRYGNVLHAPDWWLDQLPPVPLDGELYNADYRQDLISCVKRIEPDERWSFVRYHVFDSPPYKEAFKSGTLFGRYVDYTQVRMLIKNPNTYRRCSEVCEELREFSNTVIVPVEQIKLPENEDAAIQELAQSLKVITATGGEGCIIRDPNSYWQAGRVHTMLKVKHIEDAEGVVVGYVTGRETDKGSKLRGLLGALILDYNGKRLELSGFTEAERVLSDQQWAWDHPEQECPPFVDSPIFPRGSVVTFTYRGFTKDGIPSEARYLRPRM
jgi:DNA ligase-1